MSQGFGGKLGKRIKALDETIKTPTDLVSKYNLEKLRQLFGDDEGGWLWDICHGVDDSEVKQQTKTKSMLASKSFPVVRNWIGLEKWYVCSLFH